MNGHVVLRIIRNIDDHSIAFSSIDCRPGKPTVDGDDRFRVTQPAYIFHNNLPQKNKRDLIKKLRYCQQIWAYLVQ